MQILNLTNQCLLFMTVRHIFEISEDDHPLNTSLNTVGHPTPAIIDELQTSLMLSKGLIPRALFHGEMRIISPVSFELRPLE
jgi:hypothetical protein